MQCVLMLKVGGVGRFPPILNEAERKHVHTIAEEHHLQHGSAGEGADRHVQVHKTPRRFTHPSLAALISNVAQISSCPWEILPCCDVRCPLS